MAWQDIMAGEVDANSPLTSTLMSKIRNCLYYLFDRYPQITLFNNADARSALDFTGLVYESWVVAESLVVYNPGLSNTLKIRMKAKFPAPNPEYNKVRIHELNTSNYSDEHSFNSSDWEEFYLTLTGANSGLITLDVECYKGDVNSTDFYCAWEIVRVD